ncbi:MAG: lipopolysaccharide heptosyltransferase I [Betaproteobacteria bacterium]|nr:lipopolysaccharide heptosyltransferase I [Betaproteobacteria bacterium]
MPRILFVKTSSLGDVVHNCPAVSDVARYLPGSVIDWVVEESFAEVVRLHPAVREVIPVAIRRWRGELVLAGTWSELAAFRRRLQASPYDHVIDSQGLVKSGLVTWFARGRRHGFDRASAREPFAARFYDQRHAVDTAPHAVERNRQLTAAALGYAASGACDYGLVTGAPGMGESLELPQPLAVLLTMTSREYKLWPEEHWRALGAALAASGIHCVLPWGSEEERHRCARIASAIPRAVVPRRMTLTELAGLARVARFVAGVDTGLAHLAAALGRPTLGIYCGSNPRLTGLHAGSTVRNLGAEGTPPSPSEALAALAELGALP